MKFFNTLIVIGWVLCRKGTTAYAHGSNGVVENNNIGVDDNNSNNNKDSRKLEDERYVYSLAYPTHKPLTTGNPTPTPTITTSSPPSDYYIPTPYTPYYPPTTVKKPETTSSPTPSPTKYSTSRPTLPGDGGEDCNNIFNNDDRTLFTATVVARVSSDILGATDEELDILGEAFLSAYNNLNVFNPDLCDPNQRFILSVDVQVLSSFSRRRSRHRRQRSRRQEEVVIEDIEEVVIPAPSTTIGTAPTLSPAPSSVGDTIVGNTNGTYVDLLFTITGTCTDCDDDINLFALEDDVDFRRQLLHNYYRHDDEEEGYALQTQQEEKQYQRPGYIASIIETDRETTDNSSNNTTPSCACAIGAQQRPPTADEVLQLLQLSIDQFLFVTEIVDLVEVDLKPCSDEVEIFTTTETVMIDLNEAFGDMSVSNQDLEESFVCTYNELATREFCNPAFVSAISATLLTQENQSLFTFAVTFRCRDCAGTGVFGGTDNRLLKMNSEFGDGYDDYGDEGQINDEDRSRKHRDLQLSDTCFCPVNVPERAPTKEEFEAAFGICLFPPFFVPELPSAFPSVAPSGSLSESPSLSPTIVPTLSKEPSEQPTQSEEPSDVPTLSEEPSEEPTLSEEPSGEPTLSSEPSSAPSAAPSAAPTDVPSASPSTSPSSSPSASPSRTPSTSPSASPSNTPSTSPSASPSNTPSASPSSRPSASPSASPSLTPSTSPSASPSRTPSASPSRTPSASPSTSPSTEPSGGPSFMPSASPSASPSDTPSTSPSGRPSALPSASPTSVPSVSPSLIPSALPSSSPTFQPSSIPSLTPTEKPSRSFVPSSSPSSLPSVSDSPTEFPPAPVSFSPI